MKKESGRYLEYLTALTDYKSDVPIEYGFCGYLRILLTGSISHNYPELYLQKPKTCYLFTSNVGAHHRNFWWKPGSKKPRTIALQKTVDLMKPRMEIKEVIRKGRKQKVLQVLVSDLRRDMLSNMFLAASVSVFSSVYIGLTDDGLVDFRIKNGNKQYRTYDIDSCTEIG